MNDNYMPLDASWLGFYQVKSFLDNEQKISVTPDAQQRILKCRQYLDNKLEQSDELFYGINTGFGFLQNVKIDKSSIKKLQYNLLASHACGMGEEVPKQIVQLMLML